MSRLGRAPSTRFQKRNELELKRILEEATKPGASDPVTQKLGAFYGACMDEAGADKAGVQPIRALLDRAARVKDAKSVSALVTELHAVGITPLFDTSPTQDADGRNPLDREPGSERLGLAGSRLLFARR